MNKFFLEIWYTLVYGRIKHKIWHVLSFTFVVVLSGNTLGQVKEQFFSCVLMICNLLVSFKYVITTLMYVNSAMNRVHTYASCF